MDNKTPVYKKTYGPLPVDVEGVELLAELALDIRSSWNHAADQLWRHLDESLWALTHNPWVVLQTVSRTRLEGVLKDPDFRKQIDELVRARRQQAEAPAWFQQTHPSPPLTCVAYFCMEFMLSEALPIYSGGLGNVAGDQLKTASDMGIPVVGVGLLYQQGYFRQVIAQDGSQQALYPYNDPGQLPIVPVRDAEGDWLRLELALPGYSVWLRAWEVQVGRLKLYLLDSNDAANFPAHRGITSELYGGNPELRLKQELVLGIGGWRLLEELGIHPEVCHLNEGHAAFAVLERARCFMQQTGQPFDVALCATRVGNLFTTHTAVSAGFDTFPPALIERYLGAYAEQHLGLSLQALMALGRTDPGSFSEPFNMAHLAVRGSGAVNGVSRLHGEVSRDLFAPLFPRWPRTEIPVSYVTNGVHVPTWDSEPSDALWTEACGQQRWLGMTQTHEERLRKVSDADLWQLRLAASRALVEFARERLSLSLAGSGAALCDVAQARTVLDPDILTIGFARRFATYKRTNLLLHDPERLRAILNNTRRPVQLVFAGKAHPADTAGQALIKDWIQFVRRADVRHHAVFLSDYDILVAQELVQGVDVWINTPRRPWEASGTSGMKVLVNGGLNLSELDGWWAEAYSAEVGWALGDGLEHDDDAAWDAAEAQALYALLEDTVVPEFYNRTADGLPTAWVKRMRESMAQLTPQFAASRTLVEYTENHYLPAAIQYRDRAASQGLVAQRLVEWRQILDRTWGSLRFGTVEFDTTLDHHAVSVEVFLNTLDPGAVCVEVFANGLGGGPSVREELRRVERSTARGTHLYRGRVSAERPRSDYTVRAIPKYDGASFPLESGHILWHR